VDPPADRQQDPVQRQAEALAQDQPRPVIDSPRMGEMGGRGGRRRHESGEVGNKHSLDGQRTTDDMVAGGGRGVEAFPVSTKHACAPRRRLKRNRRAAPEGGGHAPRTTTRGLECVVLSGGISLGRSTRDSTGIRTTRHEGPSERERQHQSQPRRRQPFLPGSARSRAPSTRPGARSNGNGYGLGDTKNGTLD
jgi:hypothetical protein